jgi:hypothetical protein
VVHYHERLSITRRQPSGALSREIIHHSEAAKWCIITREVPGAQCAQFWVQAFVFRLYGLGLAFCSSMLC